MNSNGDMTHAGHNMITPIAHPVLRKVGQYHIHRFLKEWDRYMVCVQDAAATGIGSFTGPVTFTSAIDTDLLQSLIDLDEFGEDVNLIEEVDEEELQTWLKRQISTSYSCTTAKQVEATVKASIRVSLHEPDAKLRTMKLFSDYASFLRSRNWDSIIK